MQCKTSYCELRRKEIINVCAGARLGPICDLELDVGTGTLLALIVPGPPRMLGLLRSEEELVIPFCRIKKIGEDVILVELEPPGHDRA